MRLNLGNSQNLKLLMSKVDSFPNNVKESYKFIRKAICRNESGF